MVELRAFTVADADDLVAWIDGPAELVTWAGPTFTWPLDESQLAGYAAESGRRTWMGVDPETGRSLAHTSLRLDAEGTSGRLQRVLVAPDARGRGVGEALLTAVLRIAFDQLHLERVELGVFAHNEHARRLYERLGFEVYMVLPDVERVNGKSWTALQMHLIKTNWSTLAE
ncbi:GNAT family N-acetyltransferase [Embleya sp. NBC_00896]|uniref:GNAT family N-acetyltransferase n=1 Tax=Embleya sp. NBC_00896 TaxID=2975961 RepID=UPI00387014A0|nr:GNAT family N-acetyltransferase [Embleya sp. NBC_00896]